jgi:hypothetical protein
MPFSNPRSNQDTIVNSKPIKSEQRAELSGISYINSWKMALCTPDSRDSRCIPAP